MIPEHPAARKGNLVYNWYSKNAGPTERDAAWCRHGRKGVAASDDFPLDLERAPPARMSAMKAHLFTLCLTVVASTALSQDAAPAAATAAPQTTPPAMQKIDDLLSSAGAFFLATVDGDQPKLRPLGAHHVVDGKVWLGVGEFKNVYRQLVANPKCEVVALQPDGAKWLRWTGRAVFAEGAERERLEEVFLEAMPGLRRIYDKSPGKRMMCFTLAEARAELSPLMPPGEVLLDETGVSAGE